MKYTALDIFFFIKPLLISVLLFFQPIQFILLCVGGFIILDTVMARIRVHTCKKRIKQKELNNEVITDEDKENTKWTSRKLRMGLVPKMLTYQSIVVVFFFLDYGLLNEFVNMVFSVEYFLTKIVALILCYIELLSIDETFIKIKGKSLFVFLIDMIKHAKKVKKTFEEINPSKKDENNI